MSKLGKLFRALGSIVSKPSRLNLVLDDNEVWKKKVAAKYGLEKGLPQVELTDLFPSFAETVEPYSFLDGTSLVTDLALLKGLAQKFKDCNYLEIGTWRGESVANVASVAKKCVTINLPDKELLALGKSNAYVALHRFFSKDLKNVEHIQHNSHTFDYSSLGQKFDLLFIDGDHHYPSVKKDTAQLWNMRNSADSIIAWHDYAFSPESVRWEVLAGILDAIPKEEHKYLYHVRNTLCCIYTKAPLNGKYIKPNTQPAHFFDIQISVKKRS